MQAPGDKLNFKGRIRRIKGDAVPDREGAVRVELTGSRVPGRCMNWPRNGDREPDLRILRAGLLSTVGSDWPSAVRFVLYQVNDAQLRPAGAELDWARLRSPDRRAFRGNPVADWEIPASVTLPAGEYLLRVTWDRRRSIETNSLEALESTTEIRFEIATPQSDLERAEHAERMALLAYREGQFAKARQLAEEAVKANRQSVTPQRFQMLLAQADACLAMDDFKSGLDIYRSILKMPLDDRLAADLTWKVKVLEALVAKPKAREARPRQP